MNEKPNTISVTISPNFAGFSENSDSSFSIPRSPIVVSGDCTFEQLLHQLSFSNSEIKYFLTRRLPRLKNKVILVDVSGTREFYPITSKIKEINISEGQKLDIILPNGYKISVSMAMSFPGQPGTPPPPPNRRYDSLDQKRLKYQAAVKKVRRSRHAKGLSKKR